MNNQNTIKPGMTLDMKAKLFAQYYGQKLYHVSPAKEEGDFIDHFALRWINTFEESHLELTPLSDITDEDAIEVGKILQVNPEDVPDWINGDCTHEDFHGPFTFQHSIDYLRSKGYALPFMGYSVEDTVQAGWINLKGGK